MTSTMAHSHLVGGSSPYCTYLWHYPYQSLCQVQQLFKYNNTRVIVCEVLSRLNFMWHYYITTVGHVVNKQPSKSHQSRSWWPIRTRSTRIVNQSFWLSLSIVILIIVDHQVKAVIFIIIKIHLFMKSLS